MIVRVGGHGLRAGRLAVPDARVADRPVFGSKGSWDVGGMGSSTWPATPNSIGRWPSEPGAPRSRRTPISGRVRSARPRSWRRLNHPNIAAIYERRKMPGRPLSRAEYVPGQTLAERIALGLWAPEASRLRLKSRAIAAAHEQGVVPPRSQAGQHQDHPKGTAKVLDFGLAKAADVVHRIRERDHTIGRGDRHAGIHEPGAGRGDLVDYRRISGPWAVSSMRC